MFFKKAQQIAKIEQPHVKPVAPQPLPIVDSPEPSYDTYQEPAAAPVEALVKEAQKELATPLNPIVTKEQVQAMQKLREEGLPENDEDEEDLDAQMAALQAKKDEVARKKAEAELAAQQAAQAQQQGQETPQFEEAIAAVIQDHESRLQKLESRLFRSMA